MPKRVDLFIASGTWTAPTGVTYAIANIRAGGGGGAGSYNGTAGNGSTGGSSSAFGTTALGGAGAHRSNLNGDGNIAGFAGPVNSGDGGGGCGTSTSNGHSPNRSGGAGAYLVIGSSVTPGTGYTITVGAGGAAGTAGFPGGAAGGAGGSGAVWIEYEVSE